MSLRAASLLLLALSPGAAAQTLQGGDIVTSDFGTPKAVHVITPSTGAVWTLHSGAPFGGISGLATTSDDEVLVTDTGGSLYRIDATGVVTTVTSGTLGLAIRVAVDRNGDYLVTDLTRGNPGLWRVTPAGAVTPVYQGAPFVRPFDVTVDPLDGSILVVDDSTDTLYRMPPGGGAPVAVWSRSPLTLPQNVALFSNGDYAVADGLRDAVFRVARDGSSATVLVSTSSSPPLGNPEGIWPDHQGGFYVSESGFSSGSTGNRIAHVRSDGALTTVSTSALFSNLEDVAVVPFLKGPSTGSPGATNTYQLDFPADPGAPYLFLLSADLYPGLPFGLRATPINIDPFFLFVGANTPVFSNFVGTLDSAGRASAQLAVPAVPIPAGFALYLQPITFDFGSPDPIATFGNVAGVLF